MLTIIILSVILNVYFVYNCIQQNKRDKQLQSKKKQKFYELIPHFIKRIQSATSLDEVYTLHIQLWANGLQHPNYGPDKYGMFRTNDILTMSPDQVFLGNIWGLFTLSLPKWKSQSKEDQNLVLKQYKNQLISNLKTL